MSHQPRPLRDAYQLLVDCRSEERQRDLYEQLTQQGHACRVLTRLGAEEKKETTARLVESADRIERDF